MKCIYRLPAVVAFATIALLTTACAADQQDPPPKQAASPPSAEEWGPLAVNQSGNAVPDFTVFGTLRIGEDCATFEEHENALLIWPSERVDWNPDTRTITLQNEEGKPVILQDGDAAHFVGLEKRPPESDVKDIDQLDWINPPKPTCESDHRIFIELLEKRASRHST